MNENEVLNANQLIAPFRKEQPGIFRRELLPRHHSLIMGMIEAGVRRGELFDHQGG